MLCLQFHEDKNGTLSCNKTTIEHSLVQGLGKTCWFANNLLRFISYTKKWVRAAYWNIVNVASEIYTPPQKKKKTHKELKLFPSGKRHKVKRLSFYSERIFNVLHY